MATICRNCKANKTVRCGIRRTKERGQVQRFRCNACHKTFSEDKGFLGRHKSEETIFQTIEFYNKGLSFRQLAESFQISKNTALEWIFHFARLVLRHLWQLKPKYARHLHLDELFLKMNGLSIISGLQWTERRNGQPTTSPREEPGKRRRARFRNPHRCWWMQLLTGRSATSPHSMPNTALHGCTSITIGQNILRTRSTTIQLRG